MSFSIESLIRDRYFIIFNHIYLFDNILFSIQWPQKFPDKIRIWFCNSDSGYGFADPHPKEIFMDPQNYCQDIAYGTLCVASGRNSYIACEKKRTRCVPGKLPYHICWFCWKKKITCTYIRRT